MLDDVVVNSSPDAQGTSEKVEVNWDEQVEVKDPTADVNVAAILPPAGIYPLKLKNAQDDQALNGKTTAGGPGVPPRSYVGGFIIAEVVATGEDYDGTPIYHYLNSLTRRGKPTSDLHHLLNCAGQPASARMSVKELYHFAKEEVIESRPAVYGWIDWKASYATDEIDPKNGKKIYKDITKKMEGFPKEKDEDGKFTGHYLQQVVSPVDGEPINAQLYIRAFYTEAEAKRLMASQGK